MFFSENCDGLGVKKNLDASILARFHFQINETGKNIEDCKPIL